VWFGLGPGVMIVAGVLVCVGGVVWVVMGHWLMAGVRGRPVSAEDGSAAARVGLSPCERWWRGEAGEAMRMRSRADAAGAVAVTGAAGFIGMHASVALADAGFLVVGMDSFGDYDGAAALKRDRARVLRERHGVEVLEGDARETLDCVLDNTSFEPSHVLHLAARAGVRASVVDPRSYIEDNVGLFVDLLESLRGRPGVRLVYASSSSVYGRGRQGADGYAEGEGCWDAPESVYAATKRADEMIAGVYAKLHGVASLGLRFFTVYGEYGRPDMAVYSFADRITRGEPLALYEDYAKREGHQSHQEEGNEASAEPLRRDFTYISDIVSGIVGAVVRHAEVLEANVSVINLGRGRSEPVSRLVDLLEEGIGKEAVRVHVAMPPGDVPATHANIDLARTLLHWTPSVDLAQGIPRFLAWHALYHNHTHQKHPP